MPFLYIVRHGQAGTFTGSYDQLSEKGRMQAAALGKFWSEHELRFAAAFRGSLIRQQLTLEGILNNLYTPDEKKPPVTEVEGLNEFDLEMWRKVARTLAEGDSDFARLMEHLRAAHDSHSRRYFAYFRRANNRVLQAWMNEEVRGDYYPFSEFKEGVIRTLDACRAIKTRADENLLLVTSATPVILFTAHALGLGLDQVMPQFRWLYNTSVNVFHMRRTFSMVSFNSVEHLPIKSRTLI